jgi:transglutaminase-like putative cysteine protease
MRNVPRNPVGYMRYSVGCALPYKVIAPTTMILNLEPMRGEQQRIIHEHFEVTPAVAATQHTAAETGNRYRRLVLEPGDYTIRYEGEIELTPKSSEPEAIPEVPVAKLPLEVLPHLYPSRYCQSDILAKFSLREFGDLPPGHDRVTAICNWIFENVDYVAGTSDSSTSAHDTLTDRSGVCRDFAHLGISLCRALGIPARFVSVYAWKLMPQDFHAVFEAYLGGRWYLFDATRLCPVDSIVRIGIGRDAADTSFATFYGQIEGTLNDIWIKRLTGDDDSSEWTTDAVSVARA